MLASCCNGKMESSADGSADEFIFKDEEDEVCSVATLVPLVAAFAIVCLCSCSSSAFTQHAAI